MVTRRRSARRDEKLRTEREKNLLPTCREAALFAACRDGPGGCTSERRRRSVETAALCAAAGGSTPPAGATLPSGPGRLGEREAHGGIGLERTPEPEILADFPHRGQHFLAEQPDARLRVLVADEPVAPPEAEDGRARLLEQAPELGDHGLGRAGDDLLITDLVLERRAARVRAPADREFHERGAVRRREVTRRRRPHRVSEAGELALHPHELLGVLHGLLVGLRHVAALEIAAVFGATRVAGLGRDLIVELPDLLGRVDGRTECDVGIAL